MLRSLLREVEAYESDLDSFECVGVFSRLDSGSHRPLLRIGRLAVLDDLELKRLELLERQRVRLVFRIAASPDGSPVPSRSPSDKPVSEPRRLPVLPR